MYLLLLLSIAVLFDSFFLYYIHIILWQRRLLIKKYYSARTRMLKILPLHLFMCGGSIVCVIILSQRVN